MIVLVERACNYSLTLLSNLATLLDILILRCELIHSKIVHVHSYLLYSFTGIHYVIET